MAMIQKTAHPLLILILFISVQGCSALFPTAKTITTSRSPVPPPTDIVIPTPTSKFAPSLTPGPSITVALPKKKDSKHRTRTRLFPRDTRTAYACPARGVFTTVLFPAGYNYDPANWIDESQYTNRDFTVNYSRARSLQNCTIGVVGPSGSIHRQTRSSFSVTSGIKKVKTFQGQPPRYTFTRYFEDCSLWDKGAVVFEITINPDEWEKCKALGKRI
jgi:hypothetical protein